VQLRHAQEGHPPGSAEGSGPRDGLPADARHVRRGLPVLHRHLGPGPGALQPSLDDTARQIRLRHPILEEEAALGLPHHLDGDADAGAAQGKAALSPLHIRAGPNGQYRARDPAINTAR